MARRFDLVDVFAAADFAGNPLAVIHAAEDLSTERMQAITHWLNLSETTFLLPPSDPAADYRVRIFTLERELPFAGHPTLGTCHAWLEAGGKPKRANVVMQQCGLGLVPVRRAEGRLAFAAPPLQRSGPVSEDELQDALQILNLGRADVVDARWIDNGPGWLGILLASAEAVLAVDYQRSWPRRADLGLVGLYPPGHDAACELRAIFSDNTLTLREDPVTGSLNASVAQWLYESGRMNGDYVASQGGRLGRNGRIHVQRDGDGTIWIGGGTITRFNGQMA